MPIIMLIVPIIAPIVIIVPINVLILCLFEIMSAQTGVSLRSI